MEEKDLLSAFEIPQELVQELMSLQEEYEEVTKLMPKAPEFLSRNDRRVAKKKLLKKKKKSKVSDTPEDRTLDFKGKQPLPFSWDGSVAITKIGS